MSLHLYIVIAISTQDMDYPEETKRSSLVLSQLSGIANWPKTSESNMQWHLPQPLQSEQQSSS